MRLLLRRSVENVGKIGEIFAGRGVTESVHTEGDADGMRRVGEALGFYEKALAAARATADRMVRRRIVGSVVLGTSRG